ncbi:MAG: TIM44-like domain-containing protein [Gammaproteobacteria bacterium]|nr:TIM44-like domain-containing protein [Gammaproteobacteria bacterium]
MRKLAAVFPLLFAALLLVALPYDAEAKRMGFGGNMGRQYSVPKRSVTPPATAPRQAQAAPAAGAAKSGASRWFGPLAGLVAGGLLASLLFGDAFEGIQFMDVLMLAAVAFGIVMLLRALRRPAPAQLRTAQGPAFGSDAFTPAGGTVMNAAPAAGQFDAPTWFDEEGFIKGARTHFIRLQAAWDKGDMKDIAEYTTPELFASLQAERLSSGQERHYTEVVYLDSELLGMQRDGNDAVASIRFFGGIREEENGPVEEFSEIWHVIHAWDSAQGDWYVAGIQQH